MTLSADIQLLLGTLELDVQLNVERGEVVAVLGPNGAGKTTLLRALSGLHGIDDGRIHLNDSTVDCPSENVFVVPEQRSVGVVFQDYLLFPYLSVLDNIAFGPRARNTSKSNARALAEDWVDRMDLVGYRSAKPNVLSGGQRQRVALARALATEPQVLLLDEPLGALDVTTRAKVRRDLKRQLSGFGGAVVVVTHDLLDVFALADRVVILEQGRVTQSGSVPEVTTRPRTRYVADLVGTNLLEGHADGSTVVLSTSSGTVAISGTRTGPVHLLIDPRAVTISRGASTVENTNRWNLVVTGFDLLGSSARVRMRGAVDLVAEVDMTAISDLELSEGHSVWVKVHLSDVVVYESSGSGS